MKRPIPDTKEAKIPLFKDVQAEFNRIDELIKPGFQQKVSD